MKPMKLSIGKYNIESIIGFSNESDAIQFIHERYPELDIEMIKNHDIKALIKKNVNKSDNISEKNQDSGKVSGKVDSKRVEKSEARNS